jgi:3-hydroxyacyl-[acyl-carrier-protein] dehydratase
MRLEYFQLIDRIVDISIADRKISTEATVPTTNTIFEGHFPGFPLMPGVLLIEAMAQTSGWLVVAVNRFERMAFLAAVKDAKFRMFVTPGQKLLVKATLVHEGSGYAITKARIALGGKPICDATLTLRVLEFPNHEMRRKMRDTAALVGFPAEVPANG